VLTLRTLSTVGAVRVCAPVVLAPVAQADESTFMQNVRDRVPSWRDYEVENATDSQILQLGNVACQKIKAGSDFGRAQKAVGDAGWAMGILLGLPGEADIINQAGRNLC
jgi:hypothetical protein